MPQVKDVGVNQELVVKRKTPTRIEGDSLIKSGKKERKTSSCNSDTETKKIIYKLEDSHKNFLCETTTQ